MCASSTDVGSVCHDDAGSWDTTDTEAGGLSVFDRSHRMRDALCDEGMQTLAMDIEDEPVYHNVLLPQGVHPIF